jgi:hypothetical protein
MKRLEIRPDGWPVKLRDSPPGFFIYEGRLCFKTEYGASEVFNSAGEYFRPSILIGGRSDDYLDAEVQPAEYVWTDDE